MPSFNQSAYSNNSPDSLGASSYDRILAVFHKNNNDLTATGRAKKVKVMLKTAGGYEAALASMPSGIYKEAAGVDLGGIFMPFQTSSGNGILPSFHKDAATSGYGSPPIFRSNFDILPFRWNSTATAHIYDRVHAVSGDSVSNLVTGDIYYGDTERYGKIDDIRGVGLRLPAMGVGWGFTTDGHPWPSGGGSTSGAFFKGGYTDGRLVDPSDYVAAPIDLRYDPRLHTWSFRHGFYAQITSSSGVPPSLFKAHSWVEVQPNQSGSWTTVANRRSGTFLRDPAFEINNRPAQIGTIVWMEPRQAYPTNTTTKTMPESFYVFHTTVPIGTGKFKVLMLIDNDSPGGMGWDYPRFHESIW
jgi:hypothetical protein